MNCSIEGCGKPLEARGWCGMHYARWRKYGDPYKRKRVENGAVRLWIVDHLNFDGRDCLIWPFNKCPRSGEALMTVQKSTMRPTRFICAMIYGPPPTPKHEAAHSCGNGHKACVHPKHLRWATHAENEADKKSHGTAAIGVRHGMSKLSEDAVILIRAADGSCRTVGEKFGITPTQVSRIRRRLSWGHI